MDLSALGKLKKINGEKIIVMDKLREEYPEKINESGAIDYEWFEKEIRPHNFIYVREDKNSLSFTLQNGAIKEHGKNGCQIDTVLAVAKIILEDLNEKVACRENSLAITKLEEALMWLEARTKNRIERGVEGTDNA
jgi:hypothetical protein